MHNHKIKVMYKVIYKEQVSLDLQIEEFHDYEKAYERQTYLRQHYYNTLILNEDEVNKIDPSLRVNNFRCKN